jgi:hypothetical protein
MMSMLFIDKVVSLDTKPIGLGLLLLIGWKMSTTETILEVML